nr:hypothetical protein [Tanacetum cinerariifolium]
MATSSTKAEYVADANCCAQCYGFRINCWIMGVNTPRCDEDRIELMELTVFLLPKDKKVRVEVSVVDLQVSAVRLILLMLVQKFLLFGLTNWCCSLSAVRSIKYALTVNPNIYASCIKQFWTTVVVKKVNDVIGLQAQVDKKNVVVTKATIRDVLHLDDAEGVECLPNEDIFVELARMGYEKPSTKLTFYKAFFSSKWKFLIHTILQCMSAKRMSWNEFSFSMASAVIYLSLGRKFNFFKYIFDNLVRNVDSLTKFYMYPCFLQLMIRKQVGDLSTHTTKYTSPALTQKVFANMRLVGKGFFGVETPLFEGMVAAQEVGEGVAAEVHDEGVPTAGVVTEGVVSAADDDTGLPMDLLQTLMDTCTTLTRRVKHLELDKVAQALEITKLTQRVKKLERRNKLKVLKLRRLKRVGSAQRIDTSDDTVMDDEEESNLNELQEVVDIVTTAKFITEVVTAASTTITAVDVPIHAGTTAVVSRLTAAPSRRTKRVVIRDTKEELEAELNKTIDWDEVSDHVNKKAKEDKSVKRYQAMKRKPQTEAQERINMMVYIKNVVGFKMDYFKGMSYDDIRPIFEAKFNSNVAFLQNTKEQIDEEESEALKRINETLAEKATKRQKLDEEVLVVDYEIINQNNKPYYKIKRADGSHQLYLSFLSLLRNFDREDLEVLWSLVKERFATTKPKNFSDDFLLITLGAMFEKPDIHAQI